VKLRTPLLILGWMPVLAAAAPRTQPVISDIRAHPFCEAEGRLATQDLLGEPAPVLWNSIIGEGTIECASRSTLIVIEVTGPRHEYLGRTSVHVSVAYETATGDSVVTSEHRLGVTSWEGRYHIPVWAADTGCVSVRVRGWIHNTSEGGREETIPFECGE
jgi:hypothetical protein